MKERSLTEHEQAELERLYREKANWPPASPQANELARKIMRLLFGKLGLRG